MLISKYEDIGKMIFLNLNYLKKQLLPVHLSH